jgi:hypothetical protein
MNGQDGFAASCRGDVVKLIALEQYIYHPVPTCDIYTGIPGSGHIGHSGYY